jgi:integrase
MAGVREQRQPNRKFQGWYRDYTGKQKFFAGTTSKADTLRMARDFEDNHRKIKLGYLPVPEASRKHRTRPFSETVKEYLAWGKSQGGRGGRPWAADHLRKREENLEWWRERLALDVLADLDDILPSVEEALREMQDKGRAGKTLANHAEALKSFCRWCVTRNYLAGNPLKALQRFNTTPQTVRRALTPEEVQKIYAAAPEHRALLYEVAIVSGLRRGELRALSVDDLDVTNCGLRLHAEWTKNRKPGFQPLSKRLVERLKAFVASGQANLLYTQAAFGHHGARERVPESPLLYVSLNISQHMAADMANAKVEKKAFGGQADFHALRVTHVSLGFEAGASVKDAQALARHSTPGMTLNTYGRTRDDCLAQIVERIGDMVAPKQEYAVFRTAQAAGAEGLDVSALPDMVLGKKRDGAGRGTRTPMGH